MRTIILSDVHGCRDEFLDLLDKLALTSDDRLICAGDVVDKGFYSKDVVELFIQNKWECVMGNHEESTIRYRKHELVREAGGKKNPMRRTHDREETFKQLRSSQYDCYAWLESLPDFIRLPSGEVILHAGLLPNRTAESMDKNMMKFLRYVRDERPVRLGEEKEGDSYWADIYKGPEKMVFFGHQPFEKGIKKFANSMSLDCGACFGWKLGAYILEEDKCIYVNARQQYCEPYNQHSENYKMP